MQTALRTQIDALELLMQDHREIESLFRDFEYVKQTASDTRAVVAAACAELKMHDTGKHAVFYPALQAEATGQLKVLIAQAEAEHDAILERIEKLESSSTDATQRDAQFGVLAEQVTRHIQREENEVFPRVRELREIDLCSIARELMDQRTAAVAA